MSAVQPEMLEQIHAKIQQLEAAITRITRTKKQLKENALMAKDGIHTTISRHLETLRNREVWLLGQVDLLEHAKEDMMRHQQAELHQVIGGLKNALELMDDPNLASQLQELLQRVDKLKLSPDETPHLTFRADPLALRDAIHEYGHVDTRSLSIQRAFVSHESSSTCLPRAFEDYEDADHHMMYKTVHGLQNETVRVCIPPLSKDTNWPYGAGTTSGQHQGGAQAAGHARLPVRPVSIPSRLDKLSTTDASIQQWLQQIKQESDIEEDHDYGHTMAAVTSSPDSDSLPSPVCLLKHMAVIANSPLTAWLKQRTASTCPFEILRYFQDVSDNFTDWLVNYGKDKFPSSISDHDKLMTTDNHEWLMTPGSTQADGPPMFAPFHTATDTATWLLSKKPAQNCTGWLFSKQADIEEESLESKPAPLFEYFQTIAQEPSVWLKSSGSMEEKSSTLFDYFNKIPSHPSAWLKSAESDSGVPTVDSSTISSEAVDFLSDDLSNWVIEPKTCVKVENPLPPSVGFKPFFQNLNTHTWLMQPTSSIPDPDSESQFASESSFPNHAEFGGAPSNVTFSLENTEDELLDKWLHPSRRWRHSSYEYVCSDMEY